MLSRLLTALLLTAHRMLALDMQRYTRNGLFEVMEGKVLKGHVIGRYYVTSEFKCGALCKATTKCLSYNYKRTINGKDICELNDASRKTKMASFQNDVEYKHYYDIQQEIFKSCLDYLRNGATENGIYTITDVSGDSYQVWCDLTSEPRSAWTLFLSMALKNRHTNIACRRALSVDLPTNEDTPNWKEYRLSLNRMNLLASQSTHWRATTGFQLYGVDYTDYVRGKLSRFDILTFVGHGVCKNVEYINVRDHKGTATQAPFWQQDGVYFLHVDSASTRCAFKANSGSVPSENNFGFYCEGDSTMNRNFRGTKDDESNTQWWFGGYL